MSHKYSEAQAQLFISSMTPLLADSRFNALSRYNENRVWLDLLNLKEIHYCTILEWLLSPQEGHGLGSFFLKRFLLAAASPASIEPHSHSSGQANTQTGLTIDQIHTLSLEQAIIGREISTPIVDENHKE